MLNIKIVGKIYSKLLSLNILPQVAFHFSHILAINFEKTNMSRLTRFHDLTSLMPSSLSINNPGFINSQEPSPNLASSNVRQWRCSKMSTLRKAKFWSQLSLNSLGNFGKSFLLSVPKFFTKKIISRTLYKRKLQRMVPHKYKLMQKTCGYFFTFTVRIKK